ncbi:MAG TPA: FAD-dependent oxidoreductase [Ilumatobacteraceae bacterium]
MAREITTRPLSVADVPAWDHEADVVVVGFGHAGAAAALGALEHTPDVLILERGGSSEGTCGGVVYLGGGTPMQVAMGFEDTPEAMATFLRSALGPGVDEDKLHAYCWGSVDHYDWLVANDVPFPAGPDEEGFAFTFVPPDGYPEVGAAQYAGGGLTYTGGEQSYPFDEITPAVPRGHLMRDPNEDPYALFDGAILRRLTGTLKSTTAKMLFNMGVERLVLDDDGSIVGVEARTFGERVLIRARRGVVLTTGGFIYNDEMVARHSPSLLAATKLGHGGQDGLGIRMAQATGADLLHMDAHDATLFMFPPISFARGILFNSRGQRYINEDTYYGRTGNQTLKQPNADAYLLLDGDIYFEGAMRRPAYAGETLAELEEEIGLPPGSLASTVAYYNEHAETGDDPLFHKRAEFVKPINSPYAVIDLRNATSDRYLTVQLPVAGCLFAFTLGGLSTNTAGAVLDVQGDPVPRLFAAGRASAGLAVGGYCSGISLGDCTFFGRRAGQSAALTTPKESS